MAVVISSELVLNEADAAIPLSYPRILYDDIFQGGTITGSTEATGAEAANVADGLTWDYWQPTALPATLEVERDAARNVDYALLAAHSLGSCECTVAGEYWDGSAWQTLFDEYAPGTDKVLAFLFDAQSASKFRFVVDGEGATMPSIGIAMMGEALAVQRGVSLNHRPITLSRRTVARPQMSEGGKLLGRSIVRQGVGTQIAFAHLEADWFRENFDPFIESARTRPFGWVWHPVDYPAEVALVWTPGDKVDIVPEHAGLPDRLNVAFDVEGIVE